MTTTPTTHRPLQRANLTEPTFRSGVAARMAGMPVATLRIWEQRYQAVRPATAASGHRLYSTADVERLTLLRRLTQQGHAIGLLAALDIEHIRNMARAQQVSPLANGGDTFEVFASKPLTLRLVVVGRALACRLDRLVQHLPSGLSLQQVGVFDSLEDSVQAAGHSAQLGVDLLLWQAGSLQPSASDALRVAQDVWRARATAVVYRFSSTAGRLELMRTGTALLQESSDDAALGQWLASLKPANALASVDRQDPELGPPSAMSPMDQPVSIPRFAEAALAQFAGLPSLMACECPRHLAELIMQITSYETYSGECANKSAADAQLHAYLQRVAGAARMLFETALERVALAEGLALPCGLDDDTADPKPKAGSVPFYSSL